MAYWITFMLALSTMQTAQLGAGDVPRDPVAQQAPQQESGSGDFLSLIKKKYGVTTIGVTRYSDSVFLRGTVAQPAHVAPIVELAEAYFQAQVAHRIAVPNIDQVVLPMRLLQLRSDLKLVSIGDLLPELQESAGAARFGVVDPDDFLATLEQRFQDAGHLKPRAEPCLTTVSGRPATFSVSGPVLRGTERVMVGTKIGITPESDGGDYRLSLGIEDSGLGAGDSRRIHTTRAELKATITTGEALVIAWPSPASNDEDGTPKDLAVARECRLLIIQPSVDE